MTRQEPLLPLSPGERLHAARRASGLTRSDVATRLKCTEKLVASLENGEPCGLAPVYERGFLKAYIHLLALPESEATALLAGSDAPGPDIRPVFPTSSSVHMTDRWLRAASYVLASLLVGTLAWQVTHEVVRLSQDDRAVASDALSGAAPAQNGESGTHVNASIAALDAWSQDPGTRPAAAGTEAWRALESGRATLGDGEYLLGVNTSADSWVEIRDVDGNVLEQDLLRGGASREYRGYGPFRITLGRTSSVEFRINGQPVDLRPFAREDVTQMLLDPPTLLTTVQAPHTAD